jgi:FKBP-type peptidyl-prolyl cis-trans isomerase SlyD
MKGDLMNKLFSGFVFVAVAGLAVPHNSEAMGSQEIQKGSTVTFDYTVTVDGKVTETSVGKKPLTYVAGLGSLIPGLEEGLMGMKVGDKKRIVVPPEKGYGHRDPKAVQKVPRSSFGSTKGLKPGSTVMGHRGQQQFSAKIISMEKETITVDMNHPMVDKTLQFDVQVVSVEPPKKAS